MGWWWKWCGGFLIDNNTTIGLVWVTLGCGNTYGLYKCSWIVNCLFLAGGLHQAALVAVVPHKVSVFMLFRVNLSKFHQSILFYVISSFMFSLPPPAPTATCWLWLHPDIPEGSGGPNGEYQNRGQPDKLKLWNCAKFLALRTNIPEPSKIIFKNVL